MQLAPFDPEAGTSIAPQCLEIDLLQHVAVLATELPSANNRASILNARRETQRAQHAHTVGLNQEPSPQSLPSLLSLDKFRREAVPMKGCRRGETGDPSANDQDCPERRHIPSHRGRQCQHCRSEEASRIDNRRSWTRRNADLDQSEIAR